jgi:hypothetical protein
MQAGRKVYGGRDRWKKKAGQLRQVGKHVVGRQKWGAQAQSSKTGRQSQYGRQGWKEGRKKQAVEADRRAK